MATDWKEIEGHSKEKYQLYLCSREWSVLREAVRKRADGICERCHKNPMHSCHHLTYARVYRERLDDLQAICDGCHAFTHGKIDTDPISAAADMRKVLVYLIIEFCEIQGMFLSSGELSDEWMSLASDIEETFVVDIGKTGIHNNSAERTIYDRMRASLFRALDKEIGRPCE